MSPPLGLTVSSCPVSVIQRADLAAGHLRDVDPTVRAGAQTVGAEQPTGRGDPLESPALGDSTGWGPDSEHTAMAALRWPWSRRDPSVGRLAGRYQVVLVQTIAATALDDSPLTRSPPHGNSILQRTELHILSGQIEHPVAGVSGSEQGKAGHGGSPQARRSHRGGFRCRRRRHRHDRDARWSPGRGHGDRGEPVEGKPRRARRSAGTSRVCRSCPSRPTRRPTTASPR